MASLLLLALVAGCASPAGEAEDSLAETVRDRDRAAAESFEVDLQRAARYLRDRWGPVALPETSVERWVGASEWAQIMSDCLEDEGVVGARPADDGERVDFSAVNAEGPRELYLADVAVLVCQSRYPSRVWYSAEVADIEAPWAWQYAGEVLVPCLLASGYRPPSLPSESEFVEQWGAVDAWDPFAALAGDPVREQRARAQCPPPEALLEGAP
ncbi:hypothetical protein [Chryseoglobus sp. 28M-23]|uniref:hypothetical protein n=1 Tax=Chryseoglobus sp. 28M-23 TaxID=2772253 RepID=UPI0017476C7A|nr:hypothetical protein [Chryseoglobus sp. 28M-23]QOD92888.1 hypothetical protein IE160_07950 [Chryseoglobus sp. 28M-23]